MRPSAPRPSVTVEEVDRFSVLAQLLEDVLRDLSDAGLRAPHELQPDRGITGVTEDVRAPSLCGAEPVLCLGGVDHPGLLQGFPHEPVEGAVVRLRELGQLQKLVPPILARLAQPAQSTAPPYRSIA